MGGTPTPTPAPVPLPSLRALCHGSAVPLMQKHTNAPVVPPLQRRESPSLRVEGSSIGDQGPAVKRKRGRPRKSPLTVAAGTTDAAPTRKPAYLEQKEERQRLDEEVLRLEERVEQLRLAAGLPTKADRRKITARRVRNAEFDSNVHSNRRNLVQLRSKVTEKLQLPPVNPLTTYIHLPRDMSERRAILRAMKDVKIRRAAEIGIARFRHLDATLPYMSEEKFTTEDGVYHCNRWEMNAFTHFQSARQMFDVMVFWMYNMEISVTEMVNQVAVREDNGDDEVDRSIWNHRIVATTEDIGVTEEINTVSFAQFFDSYELTDGAPLGVIACDTVDDDDLYPYKPLERTRKDVQSFYLFREVVDPQTQCKSMVFQLCVLNAQLPPQFPVKSHVLGKLHEYMSRWAVLKNQYLSEYTVSS